MTAQILDGNALGQKLRAGFKQKADELAAQGVRPGLAVILVGEDAASQVYVRNKVNACAQAGFHSEKHSYPADVAPRMKALRTVGVPYTDEQIAAAADEVKGKTEMEALIAYLQGMGRALK